MKIDSLRIQFLFTANKMMFFFNDKRLLTSSIKLTRIVMAVLIIGSQTRRKRTLMQKK